MRVRLGWSGETEPNKWAKADVELEEEDLRRIIAEAGLPEGSESKLPVRACFQLMELEAEIQLLSRLIQSYGYPKDKGQVRWVALNDSKSGMVSLLKARLST